MQESRPPATPSTYTPVTIEPSQPSHPLVTGTPPPSISTPTDTATGPGHIGNVVPCAIPIALAPPVLHSPTEPTSTETTGTPTAAADIHPQKVLFGNFDTARHVTTRSSGRNRPQRKFYDASTGSYKVPSAVPDNV